VKPRLVFLALAALPLAGCSSAPNVLSPDAGWFAKPLPTFATPDWVAPAAARDRMSSRPVAPEDLLGADGACAGVSPAALAQTDHAPGASPDAAVPSAGGIALDMTECDVVRRAGLPEKFDIGSEGGERTVVLTYLRGARPGIYRFASGRLMSIERAPDAPAPAKPQRPPKRRA
jgi:hypothetical protein